MKRLEKSGRPAIDRTDWLEPDPLAEFGTERSAPVGPVTPRRAPRPPAPRRAPVAPPAPPSAAHTRGRIWPFALGVLCGALPSLIVLYWATTSETPRPEPIARSVSAALPAVRPPVFAEYERPVAPSTRLTQGRPQTSRNAIVPSPPVEPTIKPFVGSLRIDSMPQGARVLIDRKSVGVTPLVVTDLAVGSHVLRLEADGHTPWSSAIRVVANRQTYVSSILAPSIDRASVRP